jgi:1-acyl-sn-glycerol-3-phosphate acyltransferase
MEKFVDVEKLIASKNANLLKVIPRFVINWLKKILHEDEVNDFFVFHKDSDPYTFCAATVERFNLQLNVQGAANIPDAPTPIILVANHPLGGLDAISLIHSLKDYRTDLKFIVNDFLMAVHTLRDRFIGVNKVGKNARESLHKVEEQFAHGSATFVFPAGLVSRKKNGIVRDLEWKKTFVAKSKKYQLPVIPIYFGGRLTNRFYRLANLRKLLGIKFNIEMLYLVDEMFYQQDMHIDIIIGEPLTPSTFTKEKTEDEWAQWVKEKVYNLKK